MLATDGLPPADTGAREGLPPPEARGATDGLDTGAMDGLLPVEARGFTEGLEGGMEGLEGGMEGLETGWRPTVLKRRVARGLCVSTKEPKLSRGGSLSRGADASAWSRATVA